MTAGIAVAFVFAFAGLFAMGAQASTLYLSTVQAAGPSANNQFKNGDVFSIDPSLPPFSPGSLVFDEAEIDDGNANIDAFALRPSNGFHLISTAGNEAINGVTARRSSIMAYDPSNGATSLFLDGTLLPGNGTGNIDAIHELANGNILFSSAGNRTLWSNGDLVEYNPSGVAVDGLAAGQIRIILDESSFGGANVNIDGISLNTGGNLLISFAEGNVTLGADTFRDEDILEVLALGGYQMFFDGSASMTDNGGDINAFAYVPEPNTALLLALGLVALARRSNRG